MASQDELADDNGSKPAGRPTLDLETFLLNLERHFENVQLTNVEPSTRLQDLPQWTSLQALVVAASFDCDYGIIISDREFRDARSILDLYRAVVQKMR
jgi:acyl carrier protein